MGSSKFDTFNVEQVENGFVIRVGRYVSDGKDFDDFIDKRYIAATMEDVVKILNTEGAA